jgi:hypothetical protein
MSLRERMGVAGVLLWCCRLPPPWASPPLPYIPGPRVTVHSRRPGRGLTADRPLYSILE